MNTTDKIAIAAIIVSVIATLCSIILPYYFSKKQQNQEIKRSHISLVFDKYLLEKLPILLSRLFDSALNNELSTDENVITCDEISEILIDIKNLAILYYIVNNIDVYNEIRTLIIRADECLVSIPNENNNDSVSIVDEFKNATSQIYKLIYDNNIL